MKKIIKFKVPIISFLIIVGLFYYFNNFFIYNENQTINVEVLTETNQKIDLNKSVKMLNQSYTCADSEQFPQCEFLKAEPTQYATIFEKADQGIAIFDNSVPISSNSINANSITSYNVFFKEHVPDLMLTTSGSKNGATKYEYHDFKKSGNKSFKYDMAIQECTSTDNCYLRIEFLYFDKKNKIVSSTTYDTLIK
ncbi:MAG: hypothetical protein ACRCUP_01880 [Mycoplasmatales bacterium]